MARLGRVAAMAAAIALTAPHAAGAHGTHTSIGAFDCSPFAAHAVTDAAGAAPSAADRLFGARDYTGAPRRAGKPPKPVAPVEATVPVWFHVIQTDDGGADVSDARIDAQIAHLNEVMTNGLTFELAGVTRTRNSAWHNMTIGSAEEEAAKKALRKGGATTLNIYSKVNSGYAWGTFPQGYRSSPWRDGITVWHTLVSSAPTPAQTDPVTGLLGTTGGSGPVVQGDLAVHEAGHWLGLYHTFQGGCSRSNDQVDDTPAQAQSTTGCPTGDPDTCTSPGVDPIRNFMDYSNEACRDHFTAGQYARVDSLWVQYRDGR